MRLLYNILAYIGMPILFLRLWWRSRREPLRWVRWRERCGYAPILSDCIWVHAVSLGETLAAVPLIKHLITTYPNTSILVTNMTLTGSLQVRQHFKDQVHHAYVPFDVPHFVGRFFKRVKPKIAIIMETELWPNIFRQCEIHGIPIMLTNARLSEKSAKRYQTFFLPLMRWMMQTMTFIACQAEADGERFIRLGLSREKLVITGNVKFDIRISDQQVQQGECLKKEIGPDRLVWVAASTHDLEEKLMLLAHKKLLKQYPHALLILVPRHPERFNAISQLLKEGAWSFSRRSLQQSIAHETQVYLADSVGEMMIFYYASDIAVVAGSFKPVGGHNVLEPAALAKPVVTGPVVHNFLPMVELLKAEDAIILVENSSDDLAACLCRLAENVEMRQSMGERALKVVAANRGAVAKQCALIDAVIQSNKKQEA